MKVYFNTHTFDELIKKGKISLAENTQEADFLVLGAKKVNYNEFPKLKGVYRFGIGSDNVDFELLKQRNVPVYFPGEEIKNILYDATANFTVYAILNILYRGAFGDPDLWKKTKRDYLGKKVGLVIGRGNIGKKVADKLALFMKVETYDILANKPQELESLLRQADVITIHIPLNKETEGFFDQEKLSWVKDDAVLVNTARGALFDEGALQEKLNNSKCRAFFDVFWQEPYQGKLKKLGSDKFFMTPHSASNVKEFVNAGFEEILSISRSLTNG